MNLPSEFVVRVAQVLERLGIPYHVGGSVASSAHGMYRASADVDFVIDPTSEQSEALVRDLDAEFYVSRPAMAEALSRRSTFNAIHSQTSFKIDFFIKGPTPFDSEELRRSVRQVVGSHEVLIKSPEDTVLRKLEWFRRGGEVSERQWQDVLSILAAMRGQLDEKHLDRWARELRLSDLLERARREVADL
ncbi:MAG TPA: nucleotidyl transferase AbiEii/AbiGii toxin family protein [Candidatus Eisenbacteria bacterium]|jgi:hypothetical protein